MTRPDLEVADVFRDHGAAWREANRGHVSLGQLKVMSAIERCRTAALGGHVARCENEACGHTLIAYNSCGNRHCPKCQATAARAVAREPRPPTCSTHRTSTSSSRSPAPSARFAFHNPRVIYGLLIMRAAAKTLLEVAANPKHLGAEVGVLAVLHTWGQNLTLHPHVHCVVTGGGLSPDGSRWVAGRDDFFLPGPRPQPCVPGQVPQRAACRLPEGGKLRFRGRLKLRWPGPSGSTASLTRRSAPNGSSTPSRRPKDPPRS